MATVRSRLKLFKSTVSGLTATGTLLLPCSVYRSPRLGAEGIGEGIGVRTILKQYIFLRHKFKT